MVLQEDGRMVVTVLLSGHEDVKHTYVFASGTPFKEFESTVNEVLDRIVACLRGEELALRLEYPMVGYAARHVVGVEFAFQGEDEFQAHFEPVQRTMGFRPGGE